MLPRDFLGMWRSMSLVSVYCGILTIGSLYQFVASQLYLKCAYTKFNTFPICLVACKAKMCCLFCFNVLGFTLVCIQSNTLKGTALKFDIILGFSDHDIVHM